MDSGQPCPGADDSIAAFGANLRWWRKTRRAKLATVAREFGIATATWGHWETGRCLPGGHHLHLLSTYTGIPVRCLFCPTLPDCPQRQAKPPCS